MSPSVRVRAEVTRPHSRILKYALDLDHCRVWWSLPQGTPAELDRALEGWWFGATPPARIPDIFTNLQAIADPEALSVLRSWPHMDLDTRRILAHWLFQFSDPLYRTFTGDLLASFRADARPSLSPEALRAHIEPLLPEVWYPSTRRQAATKLLRSATIAGLIESPRAGPRRLLLPPVPDLALSFWLYFLRSATFSGDLFDNPYLRSVGIDPELALSRYRRLPGVQLAQQADITEWTYHHASLPDWAAAQLSGAA